MIASLTVVLIEYAYIPFISYGIGKTIKEVNNNILLNFLVSLPAKVSEYSILAFLIGIIGAYCHQGQSSSHFYPKFDCK